MDTSQRVKYIENIAQVLSIKPWPNIDLILHQFGFPTSDRWDSSNRESYILSMAGDVSDSNIENLAKHLGILEEKPGLDNISLPMWDPNHFRLFISHISSAKEIAEEIQIALKDYYISAFVAHKDIEPTKEWIEEIMLALNSSHALIAILTPDFHLSEWTDQEIGVVLGRSSLIIPLKLDIDPYGFIGKYQALQGKGKTVKQIAEETFQILIKNKLTMKNMSDALVSKLENSINFNNAKSNIRLLEQAQYFDEGMASRIRSAIHNNSQIEGSWGVSERINRLIEKFNIDLPPDEEPQPIDLNSEHEEKPEQDVPF